MRGRHGVPHPFGTIKINYYGFGGALSPSDPARLVPTAPSPRQPVVGDSYWREKSVPPLLGDVKQNLASLIRYEARSRGMGRDVRRPPAWRGEGREVGAPISQISAS